MVWYVAAKKAADMEWKDYGVLVVKGSENGFLVVIDDGSPEKDYTQTECR
jgi:hypothetical protein